MPFSRSSFTGFPFDESDFGERTRDRSFRSHIDDIVKRHPELAEHLNFENKFDNFPFTTNSWGHKRRGSSDRDSASSSKEATENRPFNRPFASRFGFPFTGSFDGEPEQYPQPKKQDRSRSAAKASVSEEAPLRTEEKPPQVPNSRSRKPNSNIQQSNTVDLGQKQDPVIDSRSQRSMSAPPENRAGQQRYVSSINIPMFGQGDNRPQPQTAPNSTQQPQQQQQSAQGKSNERVIPIHVEGRDTPVVPKNEKPTFAQQQPQPQRTFQRPGPFGHWNRSETPYYTGDTQFNSGEATQRPKREDVFTSQGPFKTQQQAPTPPPPQQQQQRQQSPQQRKEASPQPQPSTAVPPQPSQKAGPLDQIQCIQKDVLALMTKVELFNGKPKDKEYIYLDEMLTRNLLKLDDVDTEGRDDIRQARKETINCIQRCISILEAKAAANEQLRNQLMGVDSKVENPAGTSLEVSGVERTGSEVNPNESTRDNMEVDSTTNTNNEETMSKEESSSQNNKTEHEMETDTPSTTSTQTNETVSKEVPKKESA